MFEDELVVLGDVGRPLFKGLPEGIVAKRLDDGYRPNHTRWHKVLNRGYPQRDGRAGFASAGGAIPGVSGELE